MTALLTLVVFYTEKKRTKLTINAVFEKNEKIFCKYHDIETIIITARLCKLVIYKKFKNSVPLRVDLAAVHKTKSKEKLDIFKKYRIGNSRKS